MQTRTEYAAYVENNDFIVVNGEVIGYVYMVDDTGDTLAFDVVNEEGEHVKPPLRYGPFEEVTIVESFLDEDSTDGAEVFIDL